MGNFGRPDVLEDHQLTITVLEWALDIYSGSESSSTVFPELPLISY